jgi:hypothetical protein
MLKEAVVGISQGGVLWDMKVGPGV